MNGAGDAPGTRRSSLPDTSRWVAMSHVRHMYSVGHVPTAVHVKTDYSKGNYSIAYPSS
jgi:hypothetical protein